MPGGDEDLGASGRGEDEVADGVACARLSTRTMPSHAPLGEKTPTSNGGAGSASSVSSPFGSAATEPARPRIETRAAGDRLPVLVDDAVARRLERSGDEDQEEREEPRDLAGEPVGDHRSPARIGSPRAVGKQTRAQEGTSAPSCGPGRYFLATSRRSTTFLTPGTDLTASRAIFSRASSGTVPRTETVPPTFSTSRFFPWSPSSFFRSVLDGQLELAVRGLVPDLSSGEGLLGLGLDLVVDARHAGDALGDLGGELLRVAPLDLADEDDLLVDEGDLDRLRVVAQLVDELLLDDRVEGVGREGGTGDQGGGESEEEEGIPELHLRFSFGVFRPLELPRPGSGKRGNRFEGKVCTGIGQAGTRLPGQAGASERVTEGDVEDGPALALPLVDEVPHVDPERADRGPEPQAGTRGPAEVRDVDPAEPGVPHVEEEPSLDGPEERSPQLDVREEVRLAAEARAVVPLRAELLLLEPAVRARPADVEPLADRERRSAVRLRVADAKRPARRRSRSRGSGNTGRRPRAGRSRCRRRGTGGRPCRGRESRCRSSSGTGRRAGRARRSA